MDHHIHEDLVWIYLFLKLRHSILVNLVLQQLGWAILVVIWKSLLLRVAVAQQIAHSLVSRLYGFTLPLGTFSIIAVTLASDEVYERAPMTCCLLFFHPRVLLQDFKGHTDTWLHFRSLSFFDWSITFLKLFLLFQFLRRIRVWQTDFCGIIHLRLGSPFDEDCYYPLDTLSGSLITCHEILSSESGSYSLPLFFIFWFIYLS